MAARCYCSPSPPLIIHKSVPIKKSSNKVVMATNNQFPIKKTSPLQIRSSSRNKIFEDQSKGIVCYRDGSGEVTCEGYDEGPRLHQQLSTITYHPRDVEIIDLLQKNWLQIVKEENGDAGQKGFNWNGFNTLF